MEAVISSEFIFRYPRYKMIGKSKEGMIMTH